MAGYIYIIEFDNDHIKVGQTKSISTRIRQYEDQSKCYGVTVTETWHAYVAHPSSAETRLMDLALEWGGKRYAGREWFEGVSFESMQMSADLEWGGWCPPNHESLPPGHIFAGLTKKDHEYFPAEYPYA